ncbi:MAG: hypothetical protein KIT31_06635 [Deltaproteobacteria bacterium]|nr:hypothetical protein [Deltaproteobacteria bacterium]
MRRLALALLIMGCSGKDNGDGGDDGPPDPKGWSIEIDMSPLDRFVAPATATAWEVSGIATASAGLAGLEVAGGAASPDERGAFAASVAVAPGLTRVPILARDAAGHERRGDRTLLAARFLPDSAHNAGAAALVLDDAILASMGAGLASQAGGVDVAGEILTRDILAQDDRCVTWPTAASQGAVAVSLVQDRGDLWLRIRIPSLDVRFAGTCRGVIGQIPVAGAFGGTLDVWTRLAAKPPADGACLTAFGHTSPEVVVSGWRFDVWGTGGPLQNWIIQLFQGEKSSEARNQIAGEVAARADAMLAEKLANISVFDRTSQLDMLGRPVAMHLCLGALEKVSGKLIARVAAAV